MVTNVRHSCKNSNSWISIYCSYYFKIKVLFFKNKFEVLCCKVQLYILLKITRIKTKAISDGYAISTSYASSENSEINTSTY